MSPQWPRTTKRGPCGFVVVEDHGCRVGVSMSALTSKKLVLHGFRDDAEFHWDAAYTGPRHGLTSRFMSIASGRS
jgi:hypothetical protein